MLFVAAVLLKSRVLILRLEDVDCLLHEVPPAAGISVETGDRRARAGARVTRGRMGRTNGRGVKDPRRTL